MGGGEECRQLVLFFTLSSKKAQTTIKGFKLLRDIAAYFRKLGYSSQLENKKLSKKGNERFPSVCHLPCIATIQLFPFLGRNEMKIGHLMFFELDILEGETDNSGQCRRYFSAAHWERGTATVEDACVQAL